MSSSEAARNISQSTCLKTVLQWRVRLVRPALKRPEGGCFPERMTGLICQTPGGGGICRHPGRENNSDRVYGNVLKVFWSYFPEVGVV